MSIHIMPPLFEVIIVPPVPSVASCYSKPTESGYFACTPGRGISCPFKPGSTIKLVRVDFCHKRYNTQTPLTNGLMEIYNVGANNVPTGSPLRSTGYNIVVSDPPAFDSHRVDFTSLELFAGTTYALAWRFLSANNPPDPARVYHRGGQNPTCPPVYSMNWFWHEDYGWYLQAGVNTVYYYTYKLG